MDDPDFEIEPSVGGAVRVSVSDSDGALVVLHVECQRVGKIVGLFLDAAMQAHRASKSPLTRLTETEIEYPTIVPTTLALGPSHLAEHDSITLRFGEAVLGLAIPRKQLLALGQALVALGAQGQGH